jgi:RNA recognition motif-containing protein
MSLYSPLFSTSADSISQPYPPQQPHPSSTVRKLRYRVKDHTVFVTRLPPDADEMCIADAFDRFGFVLGVYIQRNERGQSMNYAFVEFDNPDSAVRAIDAMDRRMLKGPDRLVAARSITVAPIQSRTPSSPSPGGLREGAVASIANTFPPPPSTTSTLTNLLTPSDAPRDSMPHDGGQHETRGGVGGEPRRYDPRGYDPRGGVTPRGYDARDSRGYDPRGYDARGYESPRGYDARDPRGYDPRNSRGYDSRVNDPRDPRGYESRGYDPRDPRGYESRGYESRGYDPRDPRGYESRGYDPRDPRGYESPRGYDPRGYDPRGYDPRGYDPRGYDPRGYESRVNESRDPRGYEFSGGDPKGCEGGQRGHEPRASEPRGYGGGEPRRYDEGHESGRGRDDPEVRKDAVLIYDESAEHDKEGDKVDHAAGTVDSPPYSPAETDRAAAVPSALDMLAAMLGGNSHQAAMVTPAAAAIEAATVSAVADDCGQPLENEDHHAWREHLETEGR